MGQLWADNGCDQPPVERPQPTSGVSFPISTYHGDVLVFCDRRKYLDESPVQEQTIHCGGGSDRPERRRPWTSPHQLSCVQKSSGIRRGPACSVNIRTCTSARTAVQAPNPQPRTGGFHFGGVKSNFALITSARNRTVITQV